MEYNKDNWLKWFIWNYTSDIIPISSSSDTFLWLYIQFINNKKIEWYHVSI